MSTARHLREFHGLPVFEFPDPKERADAELPEADAVAWRISAATYDAEEQWFETFAAFAEAVDITRVRAILVGEWGEAYQTGPEKIIATLLDARPRLTALRALFVGDMTSEECEISWINQGDVTPLLRGFPELEEFGVRGGTGLVVEPFTHAALRSLTVETGGMPGEAARGIAESELPALTHLDLWLGTSEYGSTVEIEHLAPILDGARLPSLRHLALRNSEIQDAVAAAVASAPVVARLEVLDLSMGVLTDEGATALLDGQPLTHLKELDLHYHYITEPVQERLRAALEPAGVTVDLDSDGAEDDEDWRFVAVGE
ncbi:STM4015 family protein [Streptomyces sp. 4N509B]|uniref:STM4015 family protein n=1 Tax=Streptomyces sp. 4N509B TaxID=3457413 RepID=UPI003FD5820D